MIARLAPKQSLFHPRLPDYLLQELCFQGTPKLAQLIETLFLNETDKFYFQQGSEESVKTSFQSSTLYSLAVIVAA